MVIPPSYSLTSTMLQAFAKIEANRLLLQHKPIQPEILQNIQRRSLLKSSLFSARIEGNQLTLSQAEELPITLETKEQKEVSNILQAFSYLQSLDKITIDRDFILTLHTYIMKDIVGKSELGKLRTEPSAIFNQEGFAVYVPPPPSEVPVFLEQLIQYIGLSSEQNIPIKAIVSHFAFEKIHPFLDGNGRVGRLLLQVILATGGYHFNWLLGFEETLNARKEEYYGNLDSSDPTGFIEFMLDVLVSSSDQVIQLTTTKEEFSKEDALLPRRQEILYLIRDHEILSFDQIKRRFYGIPERTLRYDLLQLQKMGFIIKAGTTRGVSYKAKRLA